jgi:pyridoxine 4-dehydrogenase
MNTQVAKSYRIGGDTVVNRIGYGAMRLTGQPGNFGPYADWQAGLALLRQAADEGVTLFDTARAYGPGWNERLIGEALGHRDVVIATKGGIEKLAPDRLVRDASPEALRRQLEMARENLRRDRIDLFQLHWVDPNTPLERSVEAMAAMQAEGLIRHIGLSNVTRDELDRALKVAPIATVQNRFNQAERADGDLVDYTASLGIAFLPYGPLGAHPMQPGAALPAEEALAWLLKRSPNIIAIPGTTSPRHLSQNMSILDRL